jgi:uncharacterized membrane protein
MSDMFDEDDGRLHEVLRRNIRSLRRVRAEYERTRSLETRVADAITRFSGSMPCVYVHAVLVSLWILINARVMTVVPAFDPYPFVMLAMVASVEAIFLSTFVLVSQNRQAELAEKRAELDLQINLLAEHEITKLIALVDDIATALQVPRAADSTEALKQEVRPETVLREVDRIEEEEP